jgi:hypothetical protein
LSHELVTFYIAISRDQRIPAFPFKGVIPYLGFLHLLSRKGIGTAGYLRKISSPVRKPMKELPFSISEYMKKRCVRQENFASMLFATAF